MKFKSTSLKLTVLLILNQGLISEINANTSAYCSPTFVNGCSLWNNQSISIGTINWTLGSTSCTVSDYTSMSTTLYTGVSNPVTVTNGNWCGSAVWIDFNNDEVFDSTENLYYNYANVSAMHTYNFNIIIPHTVNSGVYRMRFIAGWGTDCFTFSANGYGPCGSYEYGNFNDFAVNIINTLVGLPKINDNSLSAVQIFPNPASSSVTITINDFKGNESHVQVLDITGKIIQNIPVNKETEVFDINELPKGIYILKYVDGNRSQSIRLVK